MKLINHVAYRFLVDPILIAEIIDGQLREPLAIKRALEKAGIKPDTAHLDEAVKILYNIISPERSKNYVVSTSVLDNLELFDTKRAMSLEGWKVFESLPIFKKTFILPSKPGVPSTSLVRVLKTTKGLHVMYLSLYPYKDHKVTNRGEVLWTLFWVDFATGTLSQNFSEDSEKVGEIAPFVYALLAFTELTDNTEVVITPGQRYGTAKVFKTQNIFADNLTIINSRWNITTIRSSGFPVRGHAAIRWVGEGRITARLVFIAPFAKQGYTRKAGKLSDK